MSLGAAPSSQCGDYPLSDGARTARTRDTMLDMDTRPTICHWEVETGHEPGVQLRHVLVPVHLAHPVTSQSRVEPQQVHLPGRRVAPCLPERLEQRQPQLPGLGRGDVFLLGPSL